MPAAVYEQGVNERVTLIEWDSAEQAIAAHDGEAYQAALAALGDGAERDIRIVEGVEQPGLVGPTIPRRAPRARMRAASTAALRALSTPTQATGTPGGIWAIDSSASRPPAIDV